MRNQDVTPDTQPKTEWTASEPTAAPRKRGFGSMDPNEVRELARRGGVAAHRAGKAHEFTSEEARAAGRKGGLATHAGRMARSS